MKEGLIKGIGLSEISAADIRKAHAVHPITAVEMEWSLFSRDAEVCIDVKNCILCTYWLQSWTCLRLNLAMRHVQSPALQLQGSMQQHMKPLKLQRVNALTADCTGHAHIV